MDPWFHVIDAKLWPYCPNVTAEIKNIFPIFYSIVQLWWVCVNCSLSLLLYPQFLSFKLIYFFIKINFILLLSSENARGRSLFFFSFFGQIMEVNVMMGCQRLIAGFAAVCGTGSRRSKVIVIVCILFKISSSEWLFSNF